MIRAKWAKRMAFAGVLAAAVWLIVRLLWPAISPEQQAAALYRQAAEMRAQGELATAERLARRAIEHNGALSSAHRLAASCALARKDYDQAIADLAGISDRESHNWLTARRMAAEILHYELARLGDAEVAYRDVLEVRPDDVFANDGYARLLGLCGRRREAIEHVLRLIRAGEATDLLMLLSRESGALDDPELLTAARRADPTDPNPLLGQANAAALAQKPEEALAKLREASKLKGLPAGFHGLLGRQLLENRRFDELEQWSAEWTEESTSPEAWFVLGEMALRRGDVDGAIRCYWESVKLRPESLQTVNRLARTLISRDLPDLAQPFLDRVQQLNQFRDRQQQAIMSAQQPAFSEILAMIQAYMSVGRLWEAFAWGRMAQEIKPHDAELARLLQKVEERLPALALELTDRDANPAFRVDLSKYPIPTFDRAPASESSGTTSTDISFLQQAADVGLDYQYFDGTVGTTRRMFEFAGGGIAVIDFDCDGAPDLFCTQGRPWEQTEWATATEGDRLFQNDQGRRFRDVSLQACLRPELGFGQGVAAGDVNNDGFADLYVANTGMNTLWLNNGDGTFFDASNALLGQQDAWTTSCLIADINGDTVPDLYDVNYLSGDGLFERLCADDDGEPIMCAPYDFDPATDRLWIGDGAGGFADRTSEYLTPAPDGKGLGIAAFNAGGRRLSLFIANDTTANFLYTAQSPGSGLTDRAVTAGLAFNGEGKAEACMGIAVGDCTQDGRLDLHVTNFLYESNTLYCPVDGEHFVDRTREFGLHEPSLPVLGFGTQFLDANLDGRLELFVANGATQDLSKKGTPYRMIPQVFEWTGRQFHVLPGEQLGAWSRTPIVGRAVARLDWNLDGKPDLAVGLLNEPTFLLTNSSPVADRRWLSLRLIGTTSARDPIGTTITARFEDSTQTHQLTAGDGYQCSNERVVHLGCGDARQVDRLTIIWPSGIRQELQNVPTTTESPTILVEGHDIFRCRPHVSMNKVQNR